MSAELESGTKLQSNPADALPEESGNAESEHQNGAAGQINNSLSCANSKQGNQKSNVTDEEYMSELNELCGNLDADWSSTTRSIRIDGTVTSVRLENFYWSVVAGMASEQGLQVPQMLTRLAKVARSGETKHSNFTSFIRVCCGRYINRKLTRPETAE